MSNHVEILIPVLHKLLECKIALITNSGLVPVDAMREEVKEGRVGSLLDRYFMTASVMTPMEMGRKFGEGIAQELLDGLGRRCNPYKHVRDQLSLRCSND